MTTSCDELGDSTIGSDTPSGALSSVLAVEAGLVVQPPPVHAFMR